MSAETESLLVDLFCRVDEDTEHCIVIWLDAQKRRCYAFYGFTHPDAVVCLKDTANSIAGGGAGDLEALPFSTTRH